MGDEVANWVTQGTKQLLMRLMNSNVVSEVHQ